MMIILYTVSYPLITFLPCRDDKAAVFSKRRAGFGRLQRVKSHRAAAIVARGEKAISDRFPSCVLLNWVIISLITSRNSPVYFSRTATSQCKDIITLIPHASLSDVKHEEITVFGTVADNIVQHRVLPGLSPVGSGTGSGRSHVERTVNTVWRAVSKARPDASLNRGYHTALANYDFDIEGSRDPTIEGTRNGTRARVTCEISLLQSTTKSSYCITRISRLLKK